MIEFNATFIVAMISFVVFIFIMNIIFYRPILLIIKKREEYLESNYNEAKILADKTNTFRNDIEEAVSQEKISSANMAAKAIEKAKKDAQDKIATNRIAASKQIQEQKSILHEKQKEISDEIDRDVVGNLSEIITDKLLEGKL